MKVYLLWEDRADFVNEENNSSPVGVYRTREELEEAVHKLLRPMYDYYWRHIQANGKEWVEAYGKSYEDYTKDWNDVDSGLPYHMYEMELL